MHVRVHFCNEYLSIAVKACDYTYIWVAGVYYSVHAGLLPLGHYHAKDHIHICDPLLVQCNGHAVDSIIV